MARRRRRWWIALGSFLAYWGWRRWRGTGDDEDDGAGADRASRERGHEPEDRTSVRGIAIFGAGLLASVVIVLFALVWFFNVLDRRGMGPPAPFEGYEPTSKGPRLQEDPAIDLQDLHEYENERLHEYGWMSKQRGVVHIPIERAMTLIAERGLPVRDTSAYRDTVRLPTESGFRLVRRGLRTGRPPVYLGSSPERYTTKPDLRQYLDDEEYLREE